MKPHGCLWPLSIPYQAAVQVRNRLYDIGVLKSQSVNAPVISVGNISVGGTGKTPTVIHLLERIRRLSAGRKIKTAVVSRGYKGLGGGTQVVADGRKQLVDFMTAGDEPVMIAEASPGTIVITDANRVRGCAKAIDELKANLILLDDGFQHRRLNRNLDIVLLDGRNPLGNNRLLPAGFLREPASSLKRADLIVLSKAVGNDEELADRAKKLGELLKKPVIATRMVKKYWRRLDGSELLQVEEIKGKKTLAFAGIARPEYFFDDVVQLGADLVRSIPLPDHCSYSKAQLDYISMEYVRAKSEWLVTTSKDALKLPAIMRFLPVYYLDTEIEVVAGGDVLDEMLLKTINEFGSEK
ncbi:tetraacyldisaccharide 4'-kinase [bacterium]|nr:tetraacyldisaccharide 4'-kinase [bacterium]